MVRSTSLRSRYNPRRRSFVPAVTTCVENQLLRSSIKLQVLTPFVGTVTCGVDGIESASRFEPVGLKWRQHLLQCEKKVNRELRCLAS